MITLFIILLIFFKTASDSPMGGQVDSRRSSVDTEQSDDSSGDSRHTTPKARPFKFSGTPRRRDGKSAIFGHT